MAHSKNQSKNGKTQLDRDSVIVLFYYYFKELQVSMNKSNDNALQDFVQRFYLFCKEIFDGLKDDENFVNTLQGLRNDDLLYERFAGLSHGIFENLGLSPLGIQRVQLLLQESITAFKVHDT